MYSYKSACGNRVVDRNIDAVIKADRIIDVVIKTDTIIDAVIMADIIIDVITTDTIIDVVIETDIIIDSNTETDSCRTRDGEAFLICWDSENQQELVFKLDCLIIVSSYW